MTNRTTIEGQMEQARRDLDELQIQVAAGEIDLDTAERLRTTYQSELASAQQALRELPPSPTTELKRRPWTTIGILGAALLVAVLVAAGSLRSNSPTSTTIDLSTISNEAMEAVIASAPPDTPGIEQMRLALANRYFEETDYTDALPHYLAIVEAEVEPIIKSEALARIGWMVFDGNGRTDLALEYIDDALALAPQSSFVNFLKARVVWCGNGDAEAAVPIYKQVLASADLPPDQHDTVAAELAIAEAGGACPR